MGTHNSHFPTFLGILQKKIWVQKMNNLDTSHDIDHLLDRRHGLVEPDLTEVLDLVKYPAI